MVNNSRFLQACRGEPHDTVPVWFMRQAGRYQPSYRELRRRYSMLELARSPELIRDVTVRPVDELSVDAAILFSDIMIPLDGMGIAFDIRENVGPVVDTPLRTAADIAGLKNFSPEALEFVFEGIRLTVERLGRVPLIGFAGAPFTLASYLVEGAPSRTYRWTKQLMWNDPKAFAALMARLGDMIVRCLTLQVEAGASALQLFDSWIGALSWDDYQTAVLPHMQRIFSELAPLGVPLIYFGVGTQHLLPDMAACGATVIGVDWRTPLKKARALAGNEVTLMGNLDPERLVAGMNAAEDGAHAIVETMRSDPRYIFNLGHGVPKETDPAVLKALVERVHEWGRVGDVSEVGQS